PDCRRRRRKKRLARVPLPDQQILISCRRAMTLWSAARSCHFFNEAMALRAAWPHGRFLPGDGEGKSFDEDVDDRGCVPRAVDVAGGSADGRRQAAFRRRQGRSEEAEGRREGLQRSTQAHSGPEGKIRSLGRRASFAGSEAGQVTGKVTG